MSQRRRKKSSREQDVTERYLAGDFDDDAVDQEQRFNKRQGKFAEQDKILRTAAMRAAAETSTTADIDSLRIGEVIQVYSLFCEVLHEDAVWLCTKRKTMSKVAATDMVVGDRVRFRESGTKDDLGRPEAVIEQVLPRATILTRASSFKGTDQHPIVANAQQMLIVVAVAQPPPKWGLVDRMLTAAQSGGLKPIVCLNKSDLLEAGPQGPAPDGATNPNEVLAHYRSLGIPTLHTSADTRDGLDELKLTLKDRATVLAGHSGVGKSSLIRAIQPQLDIRIGEVSEYTDKGRHTTTSARRYPLDFGGAVIDTPGVKQFGLWGITRERLEELFPDVANGSAPAWRAESYQRIAESLRE